MVAVANFDVYLRLVVAVLLGAAIGFERQWHLGMAGVRTNALVALGSALFVSLATLTAVEASPTRVAAQVVSGIGFLCAGVIMRQGSNVSGLNTAATLWCSAGVGVLAGQGFPGPAAGGAAIVVASNVILRQISKRLDMNRRPIPGELSHYALRIVCDSKEQNGVRSRLIAELSAANFQLTGIQCSSLQEGRVEIRADIASTDLATDSLHHLVAHFGTSREIVGIHWEALPPPNGGHSII